MRKRAPSRKQLTLILCLVFVMLTVLIGALALMKHNPYEEVDSPAISSSEPSGSSGGEDGPSESEDEPSGDDGGDEDEPSSDEASSVEPSESEPEEPGEEEEEPEEKPVFFNVPDELRAVVLSAGREYMTGDNTRTALAQQIDKAIANAKDLTMNAVIIDTKYNDGVLFSSSSLPMVQVDLDCVDYIVTKAREAGLYVYATYDVSDIVDAGGNHLKAASADGATLDMISQSISEFAEKYQVDGILLNNYENPASPGAYAAYAAGGGGIGYQNYLRQVPAAMVRTAQAAVREHAPGTQVGLLVEAVWENSYADADGSETKADYTSLSGGNADTKAMVESGLFDFVMVKNWDSTVESEKAPFRTVASWWSQVAGNAGVSLYTLHANEKLGNVAGGWSVMEQLSKQLIDQGKIGGYSGSAFNSLKALTANVGGTTTTLVQYMNDQIDETYVLQQLSISKPAQLTYKTKEPTVTFQGASDPREPVTINGEEVQRNESGYFTINKELKEGLNTFAIAHKNKVFTYNITREIIVLKEVQPTGKISVDGGMSVTVTALAYQNATVTASIGGQNITLSPSDTDDDETDRESGYQLYVGVFNAPSASESATSLGTINVTATTSDGHSKSMEGASVTVNKKAKMGDGVVVQVTADQAETFPINTLNDNSNYGYFPLPKGTVDRTYGSEIVYKSGDKTYTYWKLQSGVRVYSKDITTGGQMPDNNEISSMKIASSGQFTTVTLGTGSKIPYMVEYDGSKLIFKFQYTAKTPGDSDADNALFKSATWSGSQLTLTLKKAGGFLGYKAYYDDANRLILRFNNSPGSLSGARIVVDPGHGGNDPGALGFYPGKDEADINLAVAKKLVSELKAQGASVLMVTPGSTMASRLAAARAFNPQVLVSVHSNTNVKAAPKGTEVYYFYPFQKQLAANISANVASALDTDNRGAKAGLYYMTRESQFACVLAELGFISNEEEYTKLINSKYQTKIAQAIASGINSYLGGTSTGYKPSKNDDEEEEEESSSSKAGEESGGVEVNDVSLNKNAVTLKKGESVALKATVKPTDAENKDVTWTSDDPSIATVNASGKVTAKANGTTIITVETDDGSYTDECDVTVSSTASSSSSTGTAAVTGVSLNHETLELGVGDTLQLTATVKPSNAKNKDVVWETDDKEIATVSSKGLVTAKSDGTAYITVRTKDGDYSAECEVEVGERDNSGGLIKKIVIDGDTTLSTDSRITLEATITPYNAEDPGLKWSVSNSDIAKLTPVYKSNGDKDELKVKVEGLKNGTVTVTATAYDEGKAKATHTIKVGTGKYSGSSSSKDDDDDDDEVEHKDGVLVKSIKIKGDSTLSRDSREVYEAVVTPNYAEDTGVKWDVTNDKILKIYTTDKENEVKVEGLKKGTAYLTATAYDEGKATVRFKITVT